MGFSIGPQRFVGGARQSMAATGRADNALSVLRYRRPIDEAGAAKIDYREAHSSVARNTGKSSEIILR